MEQTSIEPTKTNTALTYSDMGFAQEEDFRPEDLQLPFLTLMQSTSDGVKDGQYITGDIVKGTEKLCDKKGRVDVVPLTYFKKWMISEHPNNSPKGQFRGMHLMDSGLGDKNLPEKERTGFNLPFEFTVDGVPHRRTKVVEAYVLLYSELEGFAKPAYLWLRKGAYNRVGKDFMSHFAFAKLNNSIAQAHLLSLGAHERHNDQGDWYEFDVKPAGKVDEKYLSTILKWYNLIRQGQVELAPVKEAAPAETQEETGEY